MRGGALPPALLCAALAFALAFAPHRVLWRAAGVMLLTAALSALLPWPQKAIEAIFIACWGSVIVTAALVHLPQGLGNRAALPLAANAGLWTGAIITVAGTRLDLAWALPCVLFAFPAAWLVRHRGGIAVKVIASWLIAVAILAGTLPIVPTPGYMPDHME